jgi:hypothetical protein
MLYCLRCGGAIMPLSRLDGQAVLESLDGQIVTRVGGAACPHCGYVRPFHSAPLPPTKPLAASP